MSGTHRAGAIVLAIGVGLVTFSVILAIRAFGPNTPQSRDRGPDLQISDRAIRGLRRSVKVMLSAGAPTLVVGIILLAVS